MVPAIARTKTKMYSTFGKGPSGAENTDNNNGNRIEFNSGHD